MSVKKSILTVFISSSVLFSACSPVQTTSTNQYKLSAYSQKGAIRSAKKMTIFVSQTEAAASYRTEQMLYVKKPFSLTAFSKNSWVNPPADMLFPLIIQSLQRSGYFYAVTSNPSLASADYRLDTLLLELQQSFLVKPSVVALGAKVVLIRVSDSRVIASKIISVHVKTPFDTPYGGVIAANRATTNFTAELTSFVSKHIR